MFPVVAAVFAVASCGGGSDESAAVRQAIHGAIRAGVVERNPHEACRYASPAGKRTLLHWYQLSYNRGFRDCEAVVAFETSQQPAIAAHLRRSLGVIRRVRVTGKRATADVVDVAGAYVPWPRVWLRKRSGRWLIEDSTAIPHGE